MSASLAVAFSVFLSLGFALLLTTSADCYVSVLFYYVLLFVVDCQVSSGMSSLSLAMQAKSSSIIVTVKSLVEVVAAVTGTDSD